MKISAECYGQAVIMNLANEFTDDTVGQVQQAVDHQLEDAAIIDVVFNLSEVPYIDSTALEYLLDLQDRLAEKLGQVLLVAPDEHVSKILEVTRLNSAFEILESVNDAVKAVRA